MFQLTSDPKTSDKGYDVFVSYAHEDSSTVNKVLDALTLSGLTIFDPFKNQEEMWGRDLKTWFADIFPTCTKAAMIFLSEKYFSSSWCTKELAYVLESARNNPASARILPIRLDDSPIPAPASDLVFLNLNSVSPKEIATLTKEKIAELESTESIDLAVLTDEELVQRIARNRDQEAFEILYKRIYPTILRLIKQSYRHENPERTTMDCTDDILTDVLFKVWEQANKFPEDELPFYKWLVHITDSSIAHYRHAQARTNKRGILVPAIPSELESLVHSSPEGSPETQAYTHELAEHLKTLLKGLSAEDQLILKCWVQGMGPSEIASALEKNPPAVRMRLYKLMQNLRNKVVHGR